MTPYQAYVTYLSIRTHFTSPTYNALQFNFKVNTNPTAFEKRRDRFQFNKLAKHPDLVNYLVANFVNGSVGWVGDLNEEVYIEWVKRQESLTYTFKSNLEHLVEPFNDNFIVKNGTFPKLYRAYRQSRVTAESLLILDSILRFLPYWNKSIDDTFIWPKDHLLLTKYRHFLTIDTEKFRLLLKSEINIESGDSGLR